MTNDTVYAARYFDGHSAKPLEAQVQFYDAFIRIVYSNAQGQPEQLDWDVKGIDRNEVNDYKHCVLHFRSTPMQTLEFNIENISDALRSAYPDAAFVKSHYGMMLRKNIGRTLIYGSLALVASATVFYFTILPGMADTMANNLPKAYEEQLGQASYDQFASMNTVDTAMTATMQQFVQQIKLPDDSYTPQVVVIKGDVVNAFALPGGRIVIYDKMIREMDSANELAALYGHEYSHVRYRHGLRSMSRKLAGGLLLSVVFGDVSGVSAVFLENADAFRNLAYQRDMEREADLGGLEVLAQNGIDPKGMLGLFQTLEAEAGQEADASSEFMSTHPLVKTRIAYIEEEIAQKKYSSRTQPALEQHFATLKQKAQIKKK